MSTPSPFAHYQIRYVPFGSPTGLCLALVDPSVTNGPTALVTLIAHQKPFEWHVGEIEDPATMEIEIDANGFEPHLDTEPLPVDIANDIYLSEALRDCAYGIADTAELLKMLSKTLTRHFDREIGQKGTDTQHASAPQALGHIQVSHPAVSGSPSGHKAPPGRPTQGPKRRPRKSGSGKGRIWI